MFKIRQERSWSALNISRELFEDFTGVFGVFAPVWKCVSVFGEKLEEHECDFPGFRSQRTSKFLAEGSFGKLALYYLPYVSDGLPRMHLCAPTCREAWQKGDERGISLLNPPNSGLPQDASAAVFWRRELRVRATFQVSSD